MNYVSAIWRDHPKKAQNEIVVLISFISRGQQSLVVFFSIIEKQKIIHPCYKYSENAFAFCFAFFLIVFL